VPRSDQVHLPGGTKRCVLEPEAVKTIEASSSSTLVTALSASTGATQVSVTHAPPSAACAEASGARDVGPFESIVMTAGDDQSL
jgi:hypothetical protein